MSYQEKVQEGKKAAEMCFHNKLYNAAANRFYYCLYIRAKTILIQNNFDYTKFLKANENIKKRKKKRRRSIFPHNTICKALTDCLYSWDSAVSESDIEDFAERWRNIYLLRIRADYKRTRILEKDIIDCRNDFYMLWEKMNNG